MYRRHGQKLALVFLTCDLAVTSTVWFAAYAMRFAVVRSPHGVPDVWRVAQALPIVLGLAAFAYAFCGLYEVHRLKQLPRELGVVCQASGLLFLLAITSAFYRRDLYESRLALALFLALNAVCLMVARRALWRFLRYQRGRGLNRGRAVIVGASRLGRRADEIIRENAWTGLEVIGFVDDAPQAPQSTPLARLGALADLAAIVARHEIDHVFIALPLGRYGELPRVYEVLADLLVEVQLVPDVPSFAPTRLRTMEIDGLSLVSLREDPHCGWHRLSKRTMDLALAATALVLLSPILIGLAVLTKLSSRGPVLYRQVRRGKSGRSFSLLKFRSMRLDAEDATGPVWAARGDPRCTRLGRFMRRFSLDELPQLWNVLAGDMSLVGPRPERGVFVDRFRRQIPNYMQRHQVQAGLTGWAQVHGWRGNTSLRRRLEYDLYYISHWSIWLDLQILWMTIRHAVRQHNAH